MPSKIQLRRDTATNWFSVNPILSDGELGFETDTLKFKIGDGSTNWNGLDYVIEDTTAEPALLLTSATAQNVSSDVNITGKLDVSGIIEGSYLQIPNWIQTITNPSSVMKFLKPVSFVGFQEAVFDNGTIGNTSWQPQPSNASVYKATLNGNVDFTGFYQSATGQTLTLVLTQDATGSRLLTTSGITVKWAGGESELSTDAGAVDIVNIFYDGACYYISITKGYE